MKFQCAEANSGGGIKARAKKYFSPGESVFSAGEYPSAARSEAGSAAHFLSLSLWQALHAHSRARASKKHKKTEALFSRKIPGENSHLRQKMHYM